MSLPEVQKCIFKQCTLNCLHWFTILDSSSSKKRPFIKLDFYMHVWCRVLPGPPKGTRLVEIMKDYYTLFHKLNKLVFLHIVKDLDSNAWSSGSKTRRRALSFARLIFSHVFLKVCTHFGETTFLCRVACRNANVFPCRLWHYRVSERRFGPITERGSFGRWVHSFKSHKSLTSRSILSILA